MPLQPSSFTFLCILPSPQRWLPAIQSRVSGFRGTLGNRSVTATARRASPPPHPEILEEKLGEKLPDTDLSSGLLDGSRRSSGLHRT